MQQTTALEKDVLEHVRSHSATLSASAQLVAGVVLSRPHEVIDMTAQMLAEESQTSVGTVMRFCNSVGQSGYHSFRLTLAASLRPAERNEAAAQANFLRMGTGERMMHSIAQQVTSASRSLDAQQLHQIAEHLVRASRILILSNGLSQPIAMSLGYALNLGGHHVSYPMDHETQAVIAGQLAPGDVCFVVSHSGVTPAVLDIAQLAAERNVLVLGLTSYAGSPLAKLATLSIIAGAAEDAYRNAEAASRPVHLAVINALLAVIHDVKDPHIP